MPSTHKLPSSVIRQRTLLNLLTLTCPESLKAVTLLGRNLYQLDERDDILEKRIELLEKKIELLEKKLSLHEIQEGEKMDEPEKENSERKRVTKK